MGRRGLAPRAPLEAGPTDDERQLADEIESIGRGRAGYEDMVADTRRLVQRFDFKSLVDVLEELLARGCVLREDHIRVIHEACGEPELEHKTIKASSRVTTDLGEFTALAAAWSKDRQGDQIVRGAFANTIKAWQDRNRPIPLHWAHKGDAEYVIGHADPHSLREIAEGLYVKGKLDLDGSDTAREAWRLVKAGTAALSFGYLATEAFMRADGVQELRELDLYEISLTPTPANPDTRILSFKSTDPPESEPERERDTLSPEYRRLRDRARDEMYALLTAPLESDPEVVLEREEKRQARELRRQCDRLRLEAALGFDEELIALIDKDPA